MKYTFFFSSKRFLGLLLGLFLASCQTTTPLAIVTPTQVINAVATTELTPIRTQAPPPTLETSQTPSPPVIITPSPTSSTNTPISTQSTAPTLPPWILTNLDNMILFEATGGINILSDNGRLYNLSEGLFLRGQPWSPDETRFIFQIREYNPNIQETLVIDFATGEIEQLDLIVSGYSVYWSPDGQYILYLAPYAHATELRFVLYNVETQENTIIAELEREHRNKKVLIAGWSPDGKKIAYIAEASGQFDIFVMEIATGIVQQLTDTPETETLVAWSPNENVLAFGVTSSPNPFSVWPFSAERIYLINDSGNNLVELGTFSDLTTFNWSSDGERIAYSDEGNLCILTIVDLSVVCPMEETYPVEAFAIAFADPVKWSANDESLIFSLSIRNEGQCRKMYQYTFQTELIEELVDTCTTGLFYVNK